MESKKNGNKKPNLFTKSAVVTAGIIIVLALGALLVKSNKKQEVGNKTMNQLSTTNKSQTPTPEANFHIITDTTYTNTKFGYKISYLDGYKPATEKDFDYGAYSMLFFKDYVPGGPFPMFYVSVIPDGFTNKNYSIYNFHPKQLIDSVFSTNVGENVISEGRVWANFKRQPDILLAGEKAVVITNDKIAYHAGKEKKVFVKKDNKTYMLGYYYLTNDQMNILEQMLYTFEFTQ